MLQSAKQAVQLASIPKSVDLRKLIRNQWGEDWGDHGYCYMPYGYESLWIEAWTAAPTG